jgi:hypothetical protein
MNSLKVDKEFVGDVDSQMNDKSGPEGIPPVRNITKQGPRYDTTYYFHFRFPDMQNGKRDHLDDNAALPELFFQTKEHEPAEEKFKPEQIYSLMNRVLKEVEMTT